MHDSRLSGLLADVGDGVEYAQSVCLYLAVTAKSDWLERSRVSHWLVPAGRTIAGFISNSSSVDSGYDSSSGNVHLNISSLPAKSK